MQPLPITNTYVKSQSSPEEHFKANSAGAQGLFAPSVLTSGRAAAELWSLWASPNVHQWGWRTDSGGSELQGQAGPGAGGSAEAWPWPEDGHQREGHCQTWDILTFQQWQEEKGLPFPHPDVGTEPRHLCHGSERCFSCSGLQPEAHIPLQRPPLQGTAQTTGNPNPPAWECHSFSTKPLFPGTSEL